MGNILFFGDSITFGSWDEKGGWVDRIKQEVNKRSIDSNFSYYNAVYNLGISGDTTATLLSRMENELVLRQDDDEDPTLSIIFAIGINDSYRFVATGEQNVSLEEFKSNLAKLLTTTKKYTSSVVFVGLTPVDESLVNPVPWRQDIEYKNELIKTYNAALKEFCLSNNLPFIDVFDEWSKKDYKTLLIDGLHPNTEGHALMYQTVSQVLKENNII